MSDFAHNTPPRRSRGAISNPANRFESLSLENDPDGTDDFEPSPVRTEFYRDATKSVLTRNSSPDVPFDLSINPYRGCEHGCVYCFARPTHEFLGFSSGLDFESRIVVKENAPELLRQELAKRSYRPEPIALSPNTDSYQPIERRLKLTRRCLEVFAECRNPVGIVTKNALVTRDLDLLQELANYDAVNVFISVTSLDSELRRILEPRTSPSGPAAGDTGVVRGRYPDRCACGADHPGDQRSRDPEDHRRRRRGRSDQCRVRDPAPATRSRADVRGVAGSTFSRPKG